MAGFGSHSQHNRNQPISFPDVMRGFAVCVLFLHVAVGVNHRDILLKTPNRHVLLRPVTDGDGLPKSPTSTGELPGPPSTEIPEVSSMEPSSTTNPLFSFLSSTNPQGETSPILWKLPEPPGIVKPFVDFSMDSESATIFPLIPTNIQVTDPIVPVSEKSTVPLPPFVPNPQQWDQRQNRMSLDVKEINIHPEAIMTVPEIIAHWGYPVETHEVITRDGYILQIHRIPGGKSKKESPTGSRPVVLLQHGLLCTSSIWLLNLPHQSAGFVWADAGFDVWLGNVRGNTYCREHVDLKNSNSKFWHFSWEEMARYDLPATIDYILKETKQEQLYFVGHSQGTLTMFTMLGERPEYNKKVRKFFALAPVGRLSHVKGLFQVMGKMYEQSKLMYQIFGDNEFLSNNIFTRLLTDLLCDKDMKYPVCENFILAVSGPSSSQFNMSRLGIYLAHNPAGTSSRNMLHYSQMIKMKRAGRFDLGLEQNIKVYGKPYPREISLSRITTPTYLFYSDFDWLATPEDVEGFLLRKLKNDCVKLTRRLKEFNHNDFLWGLRAKEEIYDVITETIIDDQKKIDIQNGLLAFFQTRPAHLTEELTSSMLNRLNNTMDFE